MAAALRAPWALVGWALVGPLSVVGRALVGRALLGQALMAPLSQIVKSSSPALGPKQLLSRPHNKTKYMYIHIYICGEEIH